MGWLVTCLLVLPLSAKAWRQISLVSRASLPEYLKDLLLKNLERNQHLAQASTGDAQDQQYY